METRAPSREERIAFLRKRDGDFCMHPDCRRKFNFDVDDITLDHWIPQVAGGGWDIENLRLMHRKCNQLKGDLIPYEDGTLPKRRQSTFRRRAEKRAGRAGECKACNTGRNLMYDETCTVCGGGPQPTVAPTAYKLTPKECPHSGPWHCWMCYIGMIERQAAIVDVLDGGILEE